MISKAFLVLMKSKLTIRRDIAQKKLSIDSDPYDFVKDINGYGSVNRFVTRPWFYEEWPWPAKWLFLFQDDSMICSASSLMLNDFGNDHWLFNGGSAYGTTTPRAVNGGFSLRKVPDLLQMLHAQPFDELVAERIPGSKDYCFLTSM